MSASTRPTFLPSRAERDGEIGRDGRLADAALAAADRDDRPLRLLGGHRDPGLARRPARAIVAARTRRSSLRALLGGEAGRVEHDGRDAVLDPGHRDPPGGDEIALAERVVDRRQRGLEWVGVVAHARGDRRAAGGLALFFRETLPIKARMRRFFGWVLSDNRGGPWGPGGGGGDDGGDGGSGGGGGGPRNPWGQGPRRRQARRRPARSPRSTSS